MSAIGLGTPARAKRRFRMEKLRRWEYAKVEETEKFLIPEEWRQAVRAEVLSCDWMVMKRKELTRTGKRYRRFLAIIKAQATAQKQGVGI